MVDVKFSRVNLSSRVISNITRARVSRGYISGNSIIIVARRLTSGSLWSSVSLYTLCAICSGCSLDSLNTLWPSFSFYTLDSLDSLWSLRSFWSNCAISSSGSRHALNSLNTLWASVSLYTLRAISSSRSSCSGRSENGWNRSSA